MHDYNYYPTSRNRAPVSFIRALINLEVAASTVETSTYLPIARRIQQNVYMKLKIIIWMREEAIQIEEIENCTKVSAGEVLNNNHNCNLFEQVFFYTNFDNMKWKGRILMSQKIKLYPFPWLNPLAAPFSPEATSNWKWYNKLPNWNTQSKNWNKIHSPHFQGQQA